jgi:hypothetical protein
MCQVLQNNFSSGRCKGIFHHEDPGATYAATNFITTGHTEYTEDINHENLYQVFRRESYCVPEKYYTLSFFGKVSFDFLSCPVRGIERRKMCFGMRHEAENPPCCVAYSGYAVEGAVWIVGESAFNVPLRIAVSERNKILFFDSLQNIIIRRKLAFTVPDWKKNTVNPLGENAIAFRVGFKVCPVVTEGSAVIVGEGDLLGEIFAVERRNKPQAGECLETVADADYELAGGDKFFKLFPHAEFYPVGEDGACAEVVAEREAADENKYMEFIKAAAAVKKIVEVYLLGCGPADAEGR